MTRRAIITIAVLALVALCVPVAFAATTSGEQEPADRPSAERGLARSLGLTTEQVEKLRETRRAFETETKDLRDQLATLREQLRTLFQDLDSDTAQIEAKVKEMNEVREAILSRALAHRDEIKDLLTPEQLSKLGERPWGLGFGLGLGDRCWGCRGFGPGFGRGHGRGFGPGGWGDGDPGSGESGASDADGVN